MQNKFYKIKKYRNKLDKNKISKNCIPYKHVFAYKSDRLFVDIREHRR